MPHNVHPSFGAHYIIFNLDFNSHLTDQILPQFKEERKSKKTDKEH